MIEQSRQIVEKAIQTWQPKAIISLYSGGYDSAVATHAVYRLGYPCMVYSIDTHLSADGWRDYVCNAAGKLGWAHDIYDNKKGFAEYVEWVRRAGQPYTKAGHKKAYNRLKDRAINQMLKDHKPEWHDKVLFVSGIRQAESVERGKLKEPIQRKGDMNAIFINPLFYWTDEDVLRYRYEHDLPVNPFYETVGGSGDCQCNWGRFLKLWQLRQHSPELAAGNVALVDGISRECHGYGWDETPESVVPEGQEPLLDFEDDGNGVSPFLCQGCSRTRSPRPGYERAAEERYFQAAMF